MHSSWSVVVCFSRLHVLNVALLVIRRGLFATSSFVLIKSSDLVVNQV